MVKVATHQETDDAFAMTAALVRDALGRTVGVAVGFRDVVLSGGAYLGAIDWWYKGESGPGSAFIPSTSTTSLSYVPSSGRLYADSGSRS